MINVSWNDIVEEYLPWISRLTGKAYRLPTNEEWDMAARAGRNTSYSWGNDIGLSLANCNGCKSPWDNKQTAPVGSFKPNDFGLFDMHGNVWEWTRDCETDAPSVGHADECASRSLRGGSWLDEPRLMKLESKVGNPPSFRSDDNGFRIVRDATR